MSTTPFEPQGQPATVPSATQIEVRVTGQRLQHLCPYADEIDIGFIDISWVCNGATIELHSLREWLQQFRHVKVSHEDLTLAIQRRLSGLRGITQIEVETFWDTAGFAVRVEA